MKIFATKTRSWMPLLALGTALAVPQMTTPAQAKLFGLSEQDEIAAGQEVAAQAQKEYGAALPYNDPMAVRVRAIGEQFARLSTRKNIPYTYQVLANDKVLNAFAAPGGPVFVTRLLVTTASNDAELAYVLGHETGHIERKHIAKSMENQQKAGILTGILGALLGNSKSSDYIGAGVALTYSLWDKGYSRDQEKESDITGVRWMSQLGYDPQAAISMLGKLDTGANSGFLDKYLATHPAPKSRQATVSTLIASEKLTDVSRRQGGPKIWLAGNGGNNGYYPAYNPNTYNPNTYNPNTPVYNPAPSNTYPPYTEAPVYGAAPTTQASGRIDFGAPVILAERNKTRVVMAPVVEFARWAGATSRANGAVIALRRGKSAMDLRQNSTVAHINGREIALPVAPVVQNGILYAPLGSIVRGLGGEASYDTQNRSIWVTVGNQRGYVPLQ